MLPTLRFFDDYGSGWLWAGDEAARAAYGLGPVDDQLANRLSPATRALAADLLDRSAASLNPDYPPDGCPWPLADRQAFDADADHLLARLQTELGPDHALIDCRKRLAP